jgi:hypothetical protein
MTSRSPSLLFADLFAAAIAEWPEQIAANLLHRRCDADGQERYVVAGLGEIEEAISDRHRNLPDEVIWVNLHWSISGRLWRLARDVDHLRPRWLRAETVRSGFEQHLRDCVAEDSSWTDDDRALVRAYFAANAVALTAA